MIPVATSTRKTSQPTSITSYRWGIDKEDRSASGGNLLAIPGGIGLPLPSFFRMPGGNGSSPGLGLDEVSKDGLFTIKRIECLGACDEAPLMLVNKTMATRLTRAKVDEIVQRFRNGEAREAISQAKVPAEPRAENEGE